MHCKHKQKTNKQFELRFQNNSGKKQEEAKQDLIIYVLC